MEAALREFRKASRVPTFRLSMSGLPSDLSIRAAGVSLQAAAVGFCREGSFDKAKECLNALEALSAALSMEPGCGAQSMVADLQRQEILAVIAIVTAMPANPNALALAEQELNKVHAKPSIQRAVMGVLPDVMQWEPRGSRSEPSSVPSGIYASGPARHLAQTADLRLVIRLYRDLQTAAGDANATLSACERADATLEQLDRWDASGVGGPWFRPLADDMAGLAAVRRCALVFACLLRHRALTGSWPSSLGELKTDTRDPFSTSQLQWSNTGSQIKIWSVGPNGVDDKGADGKDEGVSFSKGRFFPWLR